MVNFFLYILIAMFEPVLPYGGVTEIAPTETAALIRLVKGRCLLCLVREGMTPEQVKQVLGPPTGVLPNFLGLTFWSYPDFKVRVVFAEGRVHDRQSFHVRKALE
jgi:hypothetical protein